MGQTLSEPITTKETTSLRNSSMMVASSSMQGWRVSMEDAHQHILELSPEDASASYFAVFDGHGGAKVAKHAEIHLHRHIVKRKEYKEGNITGAIKEGFLECDRAMKSDEDFNDDLSGCTAVIVLLKGNRLWCGNAGDSRCVAGVAGIAKPLSRDHKPNDLKEKERIIAAGGSVDFNRVNGNLALSRALGDFLFKMNDRLAQNEQIVISEPDVEECVVTEEWDFIVIACDGIWDVLSNQAVCQFVYEKIADNIPPDQICEQLMDRCLSPDCQVGAVGCDNMTVVLVCFLNGKPWKSLVERCSNIVRTVIASQREQLLSDGRDEEEEEDARSIVLPTGTTTDNILNGKQD